MTPFGNLKCPETGHIVPDHPFEDASTMFKHLQDIDQYNALVTHMHYIELWDEIGRPSIEHEYNTSPWLAVLHKKLEKPS